MLCPYKIVKAASIPICLIYGNPHKSGHLRGCETAYKNQLQHVKLPFLSLLKRYHITLSSPQREVSDMVWEAV